MVKRTDSFNSSPSLSTRTVEGIVEVVWIPTKLSVLPLGKGNRRSASLHAEVHKGKSGLLDPRPKANA